MQAGKLKDGEEIVAELGHMQDVLEDDRVSNWEAVVQRLQDNPSLACRINNLAICNADGDTARCVVLDPVTVGCHVAGCTTIWNPSPLGVTETRRRLSMCA